MEGPRSVAEAVQALVGAVQDAFELPLHITKVVLVRPPEDLPEAFIQGPQAWAHYQPESGVVKILAPATAALAQLFDGSSVNLTETRTAIRAVIHELIHAAMPQDERLAEINQSYGTPAGAVIIEGLTDALTDACYRIVVEESGLSLVNAELLQPVVWQSYMAPKVMMVEIVKDLAARNGTDPADELVQLLSDGIGPPGLRKLCERSTQNAAQAFRLRLSIEREASQLVRDVESMPAAPKVGLGRERAVAAVEAVWPSGPDQHSL